MLYCLQEAEGFGKSFVVFGRRDRVGDDAGAGVKVCRAVFADGGADRDAELAFAVETEVPERAGVRAAGDWLKFVDDFHSTEFWRAGNAAARETGGKRGKMGYPGAQAAFDRRNEMLDLGETFEPDEFRDLDRTELADLAQVITQQVGDHHEFSHFLGTGLKFVSELGVTSGIGGAWPGAFDRARLDVRAAESEEKFGGRRAELEIAAVEVSGKWGWRNIAEILKELPT